MRRGIGSSDFMKILFVQTGDDGSSPPQGLSRGTEGQIPQKTHLVIEGRRGAPFGTAASIVHRGREALSFSWGIPSDTIQHHHAAASGV